MNYLGVYAAGVATPIALWFAFGRCIVCQRNVWRGFKVERDLVGDILVTFGFATLLLTPKPLVDRLWRALRAYSTMKKTGDV